MSKKKSSSPSRSSPTKDSKRSSVSVAKSKYYGQYLIITSIFVLMLSIFYFKHISIIASDRRIIGIGDLHGDLRNTIKVLQMSKVINDKLEWISGNDIMVQTGDVVDRGRDAKQIYKLLRDLKTQAKERGGDVIQLLGNHEIMNLVDLWHYVTQEDILEFGGIEERKKAFNKDNGYLGTYLKKLNISAIVNSTIFVHGGIHPEWAKTLGLEKLNLITNQLLEEKPVEELKKDYFLFGPDSPTWYRGYAQEPEDTICPLLNEALRTLKVDRMVVGHTPQKSGKILSRCNGRFIDIDVGISSVYGGHLAALEIYPDHVNALYPFGAVRI